MSTIHRSDRLAEIYYCVRDSQLYHHHRHRNDNVSRLARLENTNSRPAKHAHSPEVTEDHSLAG